MKRLMLACTFLVQMVCAQEWQAEIMTGAVAYNGDLSRKALNLHTLRPFVNINIKYEFYYLVLRAGLTYTQLVGHDKYNSDPSLRSRNLGFHNNIWELSLVAEYNLMEPDLFDAYPYLLGGVGVFRHNPFSYDNEGNKVKLQPLRTEGQGLPEYPGRKKYSLLQACIPLGAGWKWKVSEKLDIACELSYRILFTDYLDDVSTTYASPAVLGSRVGPKSVEMANRAKPLPGSSYVPQAGDNRGNPNVKDNYIMGGVKLILHLDKRKT